MLSNEFLAAAMAAPSDRLNQAMKILKGEPDKKATMPTVPDRFLNLTELAKVIGIGRMSLWRWRVPGHNHAGRTHYRASEVLAYLDSPEFQKTVEALKTNGWRRPSAADVARVTIEPGLQDGERAAIAGGEHV